MKSNLRNILYKCRDRVDGWSKYEMLAQNCSESMHDLTADIKIVILVEKSTYGCFIELIERVDS